MFSVKVQVVHLKFLFGVTYRYINQLLFIFYHRALSFVFVLQAR